MKAILTCCYLLFVFIRTDAETDNLGGDFATDATQFPYHVSIRDASSQFLGNGCMVGSKWVLTAAHCVVGKNAFYIVHSTISIFMTGGKGVKILQVIPHPQYNPNVFHRHDIALLRLAMSLTFIPTLQPLLIPNFNLSPGTSLTATGWGSMTTSGTSPINLRYVETNSMHNSQCSQYLPPFISIYSGSVCTLHPTKKAMCLGDDGGPLVNNQYVHGIMSWNDNPCVVGEPDVNIRVYYYRKWLWNYVP